MTVNAPSPYPADALEANRRGALSSTQVKNLRNFAGSRRKGGLQFAAVLTVIGVLVGFFASPTASHAARVLIPLGCFLIAAFLIVRFLGGGDPIVRDLRAGKVESVEGAIGKRRVPTEHHALHYLQVGDSEFSCGSATYEAVPDAGYLRLYYLPQSRHIVNFELLPDAPVAASSVSIGGVAKSLGAAVKAHSPRERNEARAQLAGMAHAMQAAFAAPDAPPPPEARDPRPLAQAILGTWSNGFVTVTFFSDGRVSANMMGKDRPGRWSIDAAGHLHAEAGGQQMSGEAWVSGDKLIVSADGRGLTLTRQA